MILLGQATVPTSSTVAVFTIPPGYGQTIIYQPSQPQAVYVGTSVRVSSASGLPVPVTPMNLENYTGSAGATVYATTGNATASSFMYMIITAQ